MRLPQPNLSIDIRFGWVVIEKTPPHTFSKAVESAVR